MSELQNIARLLKRTYEKSAWHGPSAKEVLQQVSANNARKRLPGTHSIIELVTHMTAWRNFTIAKLLSDDPYSVTDEMNFPSSSDWEEALTELEKSQVRLLDAIAAFRESRLHDKVPNTSHSYSFYTLLHGIIHHDVYHIGQIMLINKSVDQPDQAV